MHMACGDGTRRYSSGEVMFARCDKSYLQMQERPGRLLYRAEAHSNHTRVRSNLPRNRRHVGDLHVDLPHVSRVNYLGARLLQFLEVLQRLLDGFNLATVHQRQNPYTLVAAASGGGATES